MHKDGWRVVRIREWVSTGRVAWLGSTLVVASSSGGDTQWVACSDRVLRKGRRRLEVVEEVEVPKSLLDTPIEIWLAGNGSSMLSIMVNTVNQVREE